jgi:hypothetical protein
MVQSKRGGVAQAGNDSRRGWVGRESSEATSSSSPPYSINTPLTAFNLEIRVSPAFQNTPINTVDVYVIYLQSTFNFPSWQAGLSGRETR